MTAAHRRELPTLPELTSIKKVHIIGICGTAMGSLAALLKERGYEVSGSDAMAYPPMSDWLQARSIAIQSGYDAAHLPEDCDLVVVGNVARRDNPESVEAQRRSLPSLSLPEVLRVLVFPGHDVSVITGTHGKTTTSAMLAWILHEAGQDPSFFIGGITGNFDSNYRLGSGVPFVIEGDEYDTAWFDKVPKFWHYPARFASINNVEFDHADIYANLDEILHVFSRFAATVPEDGALWVRHDDANARRCAAHARCQVRTFGLVNDADLSAAVLREDAGFSEVSVRLKGEGSFEATLPLTGDFNVLNALGALGLASEQGVALREGLRALERFRSVQRRQQKVAEHNGIVVIDDFAHHPSAVAATLRALRGHYPGRRILAAFEAKSNTSRRAVFQQEYAEALSHADFVWLSPPWKKDHLPESETLSIEQLVGDLNDRGTVAKKLDQIDEIASAMLHEARSGDVLVTLSGSNFGNLAKELAEGISR